MRLNELKEERSALEIELVRINSDLSHLTAGMNNACGRERAIINSKRLVLKDSRVAIIERRQLMSFEIKRAKADANAEYIEAQKARKFETIKLIRELIDDYDKIAGEAKRFSVKRRMAAKFSDELTGVLKAKG